MRQISVVIACLLLLHFFIPVHAQSVSEKGADSRYQLSGTVTDSNGNALTGAVIEITRSGDSAFLRKTLTDGIGRFVFPLLENGSYLVAVSHLGYLKVKGIPAAVQDADVQLKALSLSINPKELQAVSVVGRKPVIQQKIDMTVINVSGNILKQADNALDVLGMAPGIIVSDNEDNISMTGKEDVVIMLNGRIVNMSKRDLARFLKSMPVSSISQVEVITNPSSKYDLKGKRGILNIKTKRDEKLTGLSGTLNTSASRAVHSMGDYTTNLNYGANKLYFTAYGGYHYGKYQTKIAETRYGIPVQNRNGVSIDQWSNPIARVGADYFISKRHTIGALGEWQQTSNESSYYNESRFEGQNTDSTFITSSFSPNKRTWKTGNLNYRYADTTGNEIQVDFDRSYYKKDDNNNIYNSIRKTSGTSAFPSYLFNTITMIDITSFKVDYTKSFKNNGKFEAGIKVSKVETDNNLLVHYSANNIIKLDSNMSNSFIYDEKFTAAYFNFGQSLGKKWGIQFGLRVEHSDLKGIATDVKGNRIQKPDSNYVSWLPSFYLSYQPSDDHSFRFSAVRKISRPGYDQLQPFNYQVDPYYYRIGNSSLRPEINDNFELSYTLKNSATFSASYAIASEFYYNVLYKQGNVFYETVANTGTEKVFNFVASYPLTFTKWWNSTNTLNVFNNAFKGQILDQQLDMSAWGYSISTSQRFTLPSKYVLRVSAWYKSSSQRLYLKYEPRGSISFSIGKRFWKDNLTIRGGLSDLFLTQPTVTKVNFGSLQYRQKAIAETRSVFLDVSLKFGNSKLKKPRERNNSNVEERTRSGK